MAAHQFVICIDNTDYEASLELRKLYELLPDPAAEAHDQLRVIDESGEDYIYPRSLFLRVELPEHIADQVARTT